jgi:hypothetical protein
MRSDNQQEFKYWYDVPITTLQASGNPYALDYITNGDTTTTPGRYCSGVFLYVCGGGCKQWLSLICEV